jgi:hypothetical protein
MLPSAARLATPGTLIAAAASVTNGPQAVLNKVSPGRCEGHDCGSFADVARTIITDSGDFGRFALVVRSLLAIIFLLCIGCLIGGWYKISTGGYGGGQMMLAGGWGVVVLMVCAGVIL